MADVTLQSLTFPGLSDKYVIPSGGGGATEVFWATYGTTTNAEIETAYQAGKVVCCVYSKRIYTMVERTSATDHLFWCEVYHTGYNLECNANTWTNGYMSITTPSASDVGGAFWATYGTTTSAEIEAAYQAGQMCYVAQDNKIYGLIQRTSATKHVFGAVVGQGSTQITCNNNGWTTLAYTYSDVTVDSALSSGSTNPVQNKVVKAALDGKIAAPSSPTSGQFLVYDGTAWTAQTLATWSGGSY